MNDDSSSSAASSPLQRSSAGPYASDFVGLCLRQRHDRYVFGAEVSWHDPDPDEFDCSELVEWACRRLGVAFPDGTSAQSEACKPISVGEASRTLGALLFRDPHSSKKGHVVVSLGTGKTIEARGKEYGVNQFDIGGRQWSQAGLIRGLNYNTPADLSGAAPEWPGRYLHQPPVMVGSDVRQWQVQMVARGWDLKADGSFGQRDAEVCRAFQRQKGLRVDGWVGPDTWRAAWLAPLEPSDPDLAGTLDVFISAGTWRVKGNPKYDDRSPLEGLGEAFVRVGRRHGVDPRFLVAIATHENRLGTYRPIQSIHNTFGLGPGRSYPSWEANIDAAARNLARPDGYYVGKNTIREIGLTWAPLGAGNDPGNLNHHWVGKVTHWHAKLGGENRHDAVVKTRP